MYTDYNIPRFRSIHYGKHSLDLSHLWDKFNKKDREKQTVKVSETSLTLLIDNCNFLFFSDYIKIPYILALLKVFLCVCVL